MADPKSVARLADIERIYDLLSELSRRIGGPRKLGDISRGHKWPTRGVYFFFEPLEVRSDSGAGPRVVRVGTHALTTGSRSTLAQRIKQHRGSSRGGGNHRGSIFRLLVGQALLARGELLNCESWGVKGSAKDASAHLGIDPEMLATAEAPVKKAVSDYLAAMQFIWIEVDDEPGPESLRGFVERNAIALLSNYDRKVLDPPSASWLGLSSNRNRVTDSGLWNQRHVDETHEPMFLDRLEVMISGLPTLNQSILND